MTIADAKNGPMRVSREELYRLVWTEPMTKVAPRFGLSDVGLAKVCRKYQIPRPPVGYWAKLGVGQHVTPELLPALDEESLQEIEFFRRQFFTDATDAPEEVYEKVVVRVPERLTDPHPLIAKTKTAIASKKGDRGRSDAKPDSCLNIAVSSGELPRALRIFDAVIKKWDELGGVVRIDSTRSSEERTRFEYGDDSVAVVLSENMERIENKSNKHHYYRDWTYKSTGRLVLTISGRWADGLRRRWADGKKQRLEGRLGSFIEGLRKWIAHEHESRLDDECEERQRQAAAAVKRRREDLTKKLEQRRADLEQCAENFVHSEEIRRYLSTFESLIAEDKIRPSNPETFPEWLEWAKWYADYLDPLTPTPRRDEYSIGATNTPVSSLDLTRRTRQLVNYLGVADTNALNLIDYQTASAAPDCGIYGSWSEISRVLEGLGYDVSGRRSY
jgi:hypothetical protein